ncbi:TPA: hypothetical protein JFW75_004707 [Salmonella enterica]|nr:hypothetical protein [Salmonella enterica]HAV0414839.1 hypothetical protein [Salmonella enterica]
MSHAKIFLTIVVLGTSAYANAGDLFTCKLPGNKVASVSINGAQIYYSYGKIGAQPDVQLDRTQAWFMGNQHYAGANYQLTFRVQKDNYNYVLYSQNYGDKLDEGLVVYNGSKILFNKKCTESAKVDDSVWSTQPADLGMQDEIDKMSDFITSLDNNSNAAAPDAEDNSTQQTEQTQSVQSPANGQSPIKVVMQDVPNDYKGPNKAEHNVTRHIYVYSLVDNVIINGLTIDRGNCYKWDIKPYTIAYGKRADFYLQTVEAVAYANANWTWIGGNTQYGKCMWSEVVVKTNMGEYTFNF